MVREDGKYSAQRRAAIALAAMDGSDAWLVWALTSYQRIFQGMPSRYPSGRPFTRMVGPEPLLVHSLLSNLPEDTSPPVQLAVTVFLCETRYGRWSTTEGFLFSRRIGELGTRPMREIAEGTLARISGEDHGFDQDAWRKAILAPATPSGIERLFLQTMPGEGTTHDRRGAAEALAKAEESAPWTVWLLSSLDPFMRGERRNEEVVMLDRAVIAALLESLPNEAPLPVLLAATVQLDETEIGKYQTEDEPSPAMGIGATRPIREIARDTLARITGQDHGFDAEKWREAILNMKRWPRRRDGEEQSRTEEGREHPGGAPEELSQDN